MMSRYISDLSFFSHDVDKRKDYVTNEKLDNELVDPDFP
jgi:hypothetical protein